jgi:hypothetical protein
MDFFFLGAQDLRLHHNEDKFRPNNTPDWHFCLMDQIPERRRSYWEVQAGFLLISDPPRSWQHNLEALDHIEVYQLVLSNLFKELS